MKRTITYKEIKSVKYVLEQGQIQELLLKAILSDPMFITSQHERTYAFEWGDRDNDEVYLEVTQVITKPRDDLSDKRISSETVKQERERINDSKDK
jgi:hypothetical protein